MSFRLDNFKRKYKNDSKKDVITWFNETFDWNKNCVYYAEYKYDDMPSFDFVRNNKVNGYYQQLSNKLHRSAFGNGLFRDNKLTFVWIFGNKDLPKEMLDSSLYESCDWSKLDKESNKLWEYFYSEKDSESYLYM